MNFSESSFFPEIGYYKSLPIMYYLSRILLDSCFFSMLLMTIFLFFEFCSPKSRLRTSYFFIIFYASTLYVLTLASWKIYSKLGAPDKQSGGALIRLWYYSFEIGCWNTFVTFNRMSMLIFPEKYDKLWRKKFTVLYLLICALYPFILDFPWFLENWKNGFQKSKTMIPFIILSQRKASFSTVIHALLSLGMIVASIIITRKRGSVAVSKVEIRLMFQTVFGSTLLILFSTAQIISIYFENARTLFFILNGSSDLFFAVYYYPIICVLLIARFVTVGSKI